MKHDQGLVCDHCGNAIALNSIINTGSGSYCCHGCKTVRETLLNSGLEDFYLYRNKTLAPVKDQQNKRNFGYLDDYEFQSSRLYEEKGLRKIRFYIEGAHCQACLWVLESVPERFKQIRSARFNLEKQSLDLWFEIGARLSPVAEAIKSYGYRPHPLLEDIASQELRDMERKRSLRRLGVSFACAGNIMLLSFSSYAGLEGELLRLFDRASLFLALPAVIYGAAPFYRSAIGGLKAGRFSIDVPVSIGILFGFVVSSYHVAIGRGPVYFDSVAMLVFLLLGSRFLLDSVRKKGLEASEVKSFFSQSSARRVDEWGQVKEVHSSQLIKGNRILIMPGDIVPADAKVTSGESYFNESVLSGESFPVKKTVGDFIYAGSENQGSEIYALVVANSSKSEMGKVLARLQENWGKRTHLAQVSAQFSKVLVVSVSVLALGVFFYFYRSGHAEEGLSRALAIVIITCPCALGLNIPMVMMMTMRKLAQAGIVVKDDAVIEKLNQIKRAYLDKTGTITSGKRKIHFDWKGYPEWEVLKSLESRSRHPLAIATNEELKSKELESLSASNYLEVPGSGPAADFYYGEEAEARYSISSDPSGVASYALRKNGKVIMRAYSSDDIDSSFPEAVRDLDNLGIDVYLLSGDSRQRTDQAKEAAPALKLAYSKVTAVQKEEIVAGADSLMFGDGVNDALALKSASVGVAANGGVDLALASADVYLCRGGVESLAKLLKSAFASLKIVKANIFMAVCYNILFITAAVAGEIGPLAAAILMPASSLLLLLISLVRLKKIDRLLSN